MYQMNYAALKIINTNTKKIDHQLRQFNKMYQRKHIQEAREGTRTSKGLQPVPNPNKETVTNTSRDTKTQRKQHTTKIHRKLYFKCYVFSLEVA
jgi:hypothetical protein